MVKGNLGDAKFSRIGNIPYMTLSQEEQVAEINAARKHLGISDAELERRAGLPIRAGSINDLRRGKRSMSANKWEALKRVWNPSIEENNASLVVAIEAMISALAGRFPVVKADLESVFIHQRAEMGKRNQLNAIAVLDQLIEHVRSIPSELAPPASRKSQPPYPGQSKKG